MKDWALILGVSSGFGAAAARELAKNNINIYGVHLDRKSAMKNVTLLKDELKENNVDIIQTVQKEKLIDDSYVVEIKASGNTDTDFLLNKFNFTRTRFSKYERGINRFLKY